jgi:hypothetical protein
VLERGPGLAEVVPAGCKPGPFGRVEVRGETGRERGGPKQVIGERMEPPALAVAHEVSDQVRFCV